MTFKIVTIGCGSIAWRGHGPSYEKYAQNHPDVELAACVDLDITKAEAFRERFGFKRAYADIDTALSTEKPDAVCLVVPFQVTAQLAVPILDKGYSLLTEKPPGMTGQETLLLIQAAERSGAANQVAWNRRWMPIIAHTKRWISEQLAPGQLHHISYDLHRVDRIGSDASITMVHGIDAVKFLAGSDYKQARFHYQTFEHHGASETNIHMEAEFESGVMAQICYFPLSGSVLERAVIQAADHTKFLQLPFWTSKDSSGKVSLMQNNELQSELYGGEIAESEEEFITNGFYAENAAFFDAIRAGHKPNDSLKSALQSVEIAEAIRLRKPSYANSTDPFR
jgi:myo-inositol 2-dehydrogenase/D-chiro-inositol 1-dehydrogenase